MDLWLLAFQTTFMKIVTFDVQNIQYFLKFAAVLNFWQLTHLYSIIAFTCILYILEFNLLVYTKLYLLSKNIYLYSLKLLVLCEYWPETATNVKFQKFFTNVMLANRSLETCFAFI